VEEVTQDGIPINGEVYAVPTISDFDIAEARIMKRYSGVVLEDFAPVHPEATPEVRAAHEKKLEGILTDPDFKAAFAHIAYRRVHPNVGYDEIAALVEKVSLVDVTLALFEEEEDVSPPSLSESESNSASSEPSYSSDSGSPSTSDSDSPDENPPTTGTSESATSSPVSLVATSGN
jgi:hypothetical protein